jgi:tetratricopeptide (TPR) repeat protein
MKYLIALTFYLFTFLANGQDATDERMYRAYLSPEKATDSWKQAVAERQAALQADPQNNQAAYSLALAHFGLLSGTMRFRDEDLFDEYYDATVDNLKSLISTNKSWGEPHALLSAVYGLKMGYSPMQGMFLGSKSNTLTEKARKFSPQSPLVWKVYANAKFFTPEMWGGDLAEAIEGYEKCIQLYESNPQQLQFNWIYLDALAFQGQAYLKNGDTGKAIETYEKALKAEPSFGYVRDVLLPAARKQQGK